MMEKWKHSTENQGIGNTEIMRRIQGNQMHSLAILCGSVSPLLCIMRFIMEMVVDDKTD